MTDKPPHFRLLKPTPFLYFVLGLVISILTLVVIGVLLQQPMGGIAIILVMFVPFSLVPVIAEILKNRAQERKEPENSWFEYDVAKEKKRYGALRAKRLFGHPIGRKKK